MRRLAFLFLLLATTLHAQLAGFDDYARRALHDWNVPGVAVAIVKDDKVVLATGYGVRRVGAAERVDGRTVFGIASNTKAFASATVAMLVDEKKVSWDDPVTRHLPSFQMRDPWVTRELRVRDLLCHRNGLAPYGGDAMTWGSSYTREEVLARIRNVEPVSSFRSRYAYQNGMFIAAGEVVEAASGRVWEDFVRERIFVPLGMTSTSTSVKNLEGNVATPHFYIDGRHEPIPWRNIDNLGAAAVINSNAEDLAKWMRLQLGEGVFEGKRFWSREAAHEMWSMHTPVVLPLEQPNPPARFAGYGLGWAMRDYRGRKLLRHGGWTDGMLSSVTLIPEERIGVAVLTNSHNRNLTTALTYRILDAFLGAPAEDWSAYFLARTKKEEADAAAAQRELEAKRVANTKPSLPLASYAGTYHNEVYGDVRVEHADGRLTIRFVASPTFIGELEHWHYDVFRAKWRERIPDPALVTFTLDADGRAATLTTTLGDFIEPADYTFRRR